jgi:hypothetical protein
LYRFTILMRSRQSIDCADEMCLASRRRPRNERMKLRAGAQSNRQIAIAGAAARVGGFPSHASKICVHGGPRSRLIVTLTMPISVVTIGAIEPAMAGIPRRFSAAGG